MAKPTLVMISWIVDQAGTDDDIDDDFGVDQAGIDDDVDVDKVPLMTTLVLTKLTLTLNKLALMLTAMRRLMATLTATTTTIAPAGGDYAELHPDPP